MVIIIFRKLKSIKCFQPLKKMSRGTWVAWSVKRLTSAQVMISWFMGLSPASSFNVFKNVKKINKKIKLKN